MKTSSKTEKQLIAELEIANSKIREFEKIDNGILPESESRFRSIIENTEAGYFFIDKNGIIQDINAAWMKLYKYHSKDEIIGKHFAIIQKADDIEKAEEFFRV